MNTPSYTLAGRCAGDHTIVCDHCGLMILDNSWYTAVTDYGHVATMGKPVSYAVHDTDHCKEGILVRLGYMETPTFASCINPEVALQGKLESTH